MKSIFAIILLALALLPGFGRAEGEYSAPAKAAIVSRYDSAAVSWQNPDRPGFVRTVLFRSQIPIESFFSFEAVSGLCDLVYEGTGSGFTDAGVAPNLPYYYILFAAYEEDNYSLAVVLKKEMVAEDEEKSSLPAELIDSLAGAGSDRVNRVARSEAGLVYSFNGPVQTDADSGRLALFIITRSPHDLAERDKTAISFFIHEGTPTTILLGSGERAGVLNSYLSAFAKLPTSRLEWEDVIKIANGRWPGERNEEAEAQAAGDQFVRVWRRAPDMSDPRDNAAVTVIAYGLRPGQRNLESERNAIDIYRSIFNQDPAQAHEWDIVRAIAYSGATR